MRLFLPTISNDEVARAGSSSIAGCARPEDKTEAMRVMTAGLQVVIRRLYDEGRLDGIPAMAGSGGTAIATAAMRAAGRVCPKLMVSTVAAGDGAPTSAPCDITMMPSVVDAFGAEPAQPAHLCQRSRRCDLWHGGS